MKVVAVREAKASLSEFIEEAQRDRVLITKHGRPAALVIGVEGETLEDLLTMDNPRFWEMIEDRRRKQGSTTLAEVRARYGVPKPSRQRQRHTKTRRRSSPPPAVPGLVGAGRSVKGKRVSVAERHDEALAKALLDKKRRRK
jgi:prevent-host-death family protein